MGDRMKRRGEEVEVFGPTPTKQPKELLRLARVPEEAYTV
jgi:hypothetical protein